VVVQEIYLHALTPFASATLAACYCVLLEKVITDDSMDHVRHLIIHCMDTVLKLLNVELSKKIIMFHYFLKHIIHFVVLCFITKEN
jgi:hypothetical protein